MYNLIIFTLIFNFIIYFMMTQYTDIYLNSQSDMLNTKFNLSTSYKSYIILFVWLGFSFIFIPLMYYIYYYIINQSKIYLTSFICLSWLMWDLYPICMTNNGYKINNILMNLFDIIYAGFLWVLISLYLYNNYCKIIKNNKIIILLLLLLNIFIMMLFFYNGFIYNRNHTENNWLVKLGDYLKWNKLLPYIKITLF